MSYKLQLLAVLILDVVSAVTARYSFNHDDRFFLLLSILSLSLAGYFFIRLMEQEVGIIVNATWVALGTICVTLAGYFVFGEKITLQQGIGMATIVIGLILIEIYSVEPAEESVKTDS